MLDFNDWLRYEPFWARPSCTGIMNVLNINASNSLLWVSVAGYKFDCYLFHCMKPAFCLLIAEILIVCELRRGLSFTKPKTPLRRGLSFRKPKTPRVNALNIGETPKQSYRTQNSLL